MERVHFIYQGKEYSAELIRSDRLSPNYYWLLLDDEDLQNKFGDVAFRQEGTDIHPVNELTSDKYNDFFEAMMNAIRKILFSKKESHCN
jgi:hypothetical protein